MPITLDKRLMKLIGNYDQSKISTPNYDLLLQGTDRPPYTIVISPQPMEVQQSKPNASDEALINTLLQNNITPSNDYTVTYFKRKNYAVINPFIHQANLTPLPLPNFGCFRLCRIVNQEDQKILIDSHEWMNTVDVSSKETTAHGVDFKQRFTGVWQRYTNEPFISSSLRTGSQVKKEAVQSMQENYDRILSKSKFADQFIKMDRNGCTSLKESHRQVKDHMSFNSKTHPDHILFHDALLGLTATEQNSRQALDSTHKSNASLRLGGLGTTLAICEGDSTKWHYDEENSERYYATVMVLRKPAKLELPTIGVTMILYPGDVAGFLASELLHKLTFLSPDDVCWKEEFCYEEDKKGLVLTTWVDANSINGTSQGTNWAEELTAQERKAIEKRKAKELEKGEGQGKGKKRG